MAIRYHSGNCGRNVIFHGTTTNRFKITTFTMQLPYTLHNGWFCIKSTDTHGNIENSYKIFALLFMGNILDNEH